MGDENLFPAADVAFEVVKEEYLGEERRLGLLVSKSQTLATVASVLFVSFGFSFTSILTAPPAQILNKFAVTSGLCGVLFSTYVLRASTLQRPDYKKMIQDVKENHPSKESVLLKMADCYHDSIEGTKDVIDTKLKEFNWAIYLVSVSCILELLAFFFQFIACATTTKC